ncbi:unnamed protein product [Caenorhabditis nigoni]
MASSGPFGSIRNKKDANKKQFEDEQKKREEKEKEDQEQYMRQVEARNREREKMARRMEDTPRIDIRSEMFLEASSGDVLRPATSLMNLKDQKKVMRSISSARLPTRSALEVPGQSNSSLSAPEPPMELLVLNSPSSTLPEEPAFNLPQVSEKKAQKIDALNLSMKRQEAKGLKIERTSDWSAELGSGHSSVGPPSVVEIEKKREVVVKPETPIKVKLAGEQKKEPIDLNSSPLEVQATPVQPALVPTEHLIPVQKSKCCCII